VSSFFTPISICLNVDSWEHLEFETRPDQLLSYTLVQGDERVVIEYAPIHPRQADEDVQQTLPFGPVQHYVQMTLAAMDAQEAEEAPEDQTGAGGTEAESG
jgi:hypothetical protein